MTASTVSRNTRQLDLKPTPDYVIVGVKANATIYQGTMVALDSTGYAIMAANAVGAQKIIGRAEGDGNSIGSLGDVIDVSGVSGTKKVRVRQGVFGPWVNGDTIVIGDIGKVAYASSDVTICKGDGNGVYPVAGVIYDVTTEGVWVQMRLDTASSVDALSVAIAMLASANRCRGVATSIAGYAASSGVLTASATGAIGPQDGLTYVAGDLLFIPEGVATAAIDAGPYVVTNAGSSGPAAKFVLTRPSWYSTGMTIPQGLIIDIGGEGSAYAGSRWKSFVAKAKVVDTDAPLFWPSTCRKTVTLSSGTYTWNAAPLALRSTTDSSVQATRNTAGGTLTTVIELECPVASRVAGNVGTGAMLVHAIKSDKSVDTNDASSVDICVVNWN